jgi:hypothetical protein
MNGVWVGVRRRLAFGGDARFCDGSASYRFDGKFIARNKSWPSPAVERRDLAWWKRFRLLGHCDDGESFRASGFSWVSWSHFLRTRRTNSKPGFGWQLEPTAERRGERRRWNDHGHGRKR